MDTDTLRSLIADRLTPVGTLTHYAAARRAGVPERTIRDYLAGADTGMARVLRLAAATGILVSAAAGPTPKPGPTRGKQKKKTAVS